MCVGFGWRTFLIFGVGYMLFMILFVAVFCLISGLFYLLDTIVWNLEAGENFLEYGIHYAETRHNFHTHEIVFAGVIILTGVILLLTGLRYIKKKK